MSDNKTVPSAEAILKYHLTKLDKDFGFEIRNYVGKKNVPPIISAMHEHTRLHLEVMLKEITSGDEKVLLKRDIEKIGNNYIAKIQ